jgi:hypothetical protein
MRKGFNHENNNPAFPVEYNSVGCFFSFSGIYVGRIPQHIYSNGHGAWQGRHAFFGGLVDL